MPLGGGCHLDIDDTSYRDMPFCPRDPVNFARRTPNQALTKGIASGYGVRDGHPPYFGSTLHYATSGLIIISGRTVPLDVHALPCDPVWEQLLVLWREPNPDKLLPCDTYIGHIAVTGYEANHQSKDFAFGFVCLAHH